MDEEINLIKTRLTGACGREGRNPSSTAASHLLREADERRENRGRLQSMSNGYSGPGNKSLNFSLDFLVILYRTQVQGGSVLHLVLALRGGN